MKKYLRGWLSAALLCTVAGCGGEIDAGSRVRTGSGGAAGSGIGGGAGSAPGGSGGSVGFGTPECGNGFVESGESCDPPGSCPTGCDDGNACTRDTLSGSPDTCDVECQLAAIDLCVDGDGCCPSGCSAVDDNDCSPSCGNGTVEAGESCDPPGSCPVSCDDSNACTTDVRTGSAVNCNVACSYTDVAICENDDGCCPTGCTGANDNDCVDASVCAGAGPSTTTLDAEEQNFLVLLNQHRVANGESPVAACTSLSRAAQGHSEDMRDQNYFDHTGLDGSSPIDRACDSCYASCEMTGWGENIAAGNSGAEGTFNQWVNSPGHNANMLGSSFVVVGIGRATGGGTYGTYWTTLFGGRSDSSCD